MNIIKQLKTLKFKANRSNPPKKHALDPALLHCST